MEQAETRTNEFKDSNYELFILALSILSITNIFLGIVTGDSVRRVIFAIDIFLSIIFFIDFLYRLFTAKSKTHYFFKQLGWLDLIGSLPLPQAKIARIARIIRASRLIRRYGLRSMIREFVDDRAGSALYTVGLMVILMIEFGSIAILYVERDAPNANILTASDALWWSMVTISTVGYGDQYPVTQNGRIIATAVIILGVGLFGVITGFLANRFLADDDAEDDGVEDEQILADIAASLQAIQQSQLEQAQITKALQAQLTALQNDTA